MVRASDRSLAYRSQYAAAPWRRKDGSAGHPSASAKRSSTAPGDFDRHQCPWQKSNINRKRGASRACVEARSVRPRSSPSDAIASGADDDREDHEYGSQGLESEDMERRGCEGGEAKDTGGREMTQRPHMVRAILRGAFLCIFQICAASDIATESFP